MFGSLYYFQWRLVGKVSNFRDLQKNGETENEVTFEDHFVVTHGLYVTFFTISKI